MKPAFIEKEFTYQATIHQDEFYYSISFNGSAYYIHIEEILVWLYSQIKK